MLWLNRANLLFIAFIVYVDVALDSFNAWDLHSKGKEYWAVCLILLMLIPNLVTWAFLHVNGIAAWKDLIMVMLYLGPAYGVYHSWTEGVSASEHIWYNAAEGLGESALAGVLTAYIICFGGEIRTSFYLSILWSYVSITKAAVMVNFYGSRPTKTELIWEFALRLPEVALRISSLACFAFLMKDPFMEDDADSDTQTAVFAWIVFSFVNNCAMIKIVEPRCPLTVQFYFGAIMIFTAPFKFLSAFKRMNDAFFMSRCFETLLMFVIAVNPRAINPRVYELIDNAEFLLIVMAISASWLVLMCVGLQCSKMCTSSKRSPTNLKPEGYNELESEDSDWRLFEEDADLSLLHRAQLAQKRFQEVVSTGDSLMVSLFVHLEGVNLADPVVVHRILNEYPEHVVNKFVTQLGMPSCIEELQAKGVSARALLSAGFASESVFKHFTVDACKNEGLKASDLLVHFGAAKLLEAGFSASSLPWGALSPEEWIKNGLQGAMLFEKLASCERDGEFLAPRESWGVLGSQLLQVMRQDDNQSALRGIIMKCSYSTRYQLFAYLEACDDFSDDVAKQFWALREQVEQITGNRFITFNRNLDPEGRLGLTLKSDSSDLVDGGMPVTGVSDGFAISLWNERNPERKVVIGDCVWDINGITNDSKEMLERAKTATYVHIVVKGSGKTDAGGVLVAGLDRLREQAQQCDGLQRFFQRIREAANYLEKNIELTRKSGSRLGGDVDFADGIVVKKVYAEGILAAWNERHPNGPRIEVGDRIIDVNGERDNDGILRELRQSQTLQMRIHDEKMADSFDIHEGEDALVTVSDLWYQKASVDSRIAEFVKDIDIAEMASKLRIVLTMAFDGNAYPKILINAAVMDECYEDFTLSLLNFLKI